MKIIFLDIDGVLNGFETLNDPTTTDLKPDSLEFWAYYIDKDKVERLNQIIDETGASVVISSTWRLILTQEFITKVLESKGFVGSIIGVTPELPEHTEKYRRLREINTFCKNEIHADIRIAIDDDFLHNMKMVRTDGRYGLQDKHIKEACDLLTVKLI